MQRAKLIPKYRDELGLDRFDRTSDLYRAVTVLVAAYESYMLLKQDGLENKERISKGENEWFKLRTEMMLKSIKTAIDKLAEGK